MVSIKYLKLDTVLRDLMSGTGMLPRNIRFELSNNNENIAMQKIINITNGIKTSKGADSIDNNHLSIRREKVQIK